MKTKGIWGLAFFGLLLIGMPVKTSAFEVFNKDDRALDINVRGQIYGVAEKVDDAARYDTRLYLFLKQARLQLLGHVDEFKYQFQVAFGGEEEVKNKNSSLSLLDLSIDVPIYDAVHFRVGQFRVPYSRERITDSAHMIFADRSMNNLVFSSGRDVGGALHGQFDNNMSFAAGVFTGAGRDVPLRFLPQKLGIPLTVLRVGMDTGVDEDMFTLKQNNFNPEKTSWAFFVNGEYLKDSIVGHSSVLNVKTTEKSLLADSAWNPFFSTSKLGQFFKFGSDWALRMPFGDYAFAAEAEINYGKYVNSSGSLSAIGGRGQVSVYKAPFEFGVRYSMLQPDNDFANTKRKIVDNSLMHEIAPAATLYLMDHQAKIIFDFPMLLNVPVANEVGVGSYVLTEQSDQVSVLSTAANTITRQNFVPQARVLIQGSF